MRESIGRRESGIQGDLLLLNIQKGDSVVVSSSDPAGGMWDLSVDAFEFTEETIEAFAVRIAARTTGTIHSIKKAD